MDYTTLQSGTKAIQGFLTVDSLTPIEALNVSLKALDIVIAFEIENLVIPYEIRQCLIDYSNIFLIEHGYYSEIIEILYKNKSNQVNINEIIDLNEEQATNNLIFQRIFLLGLNSSVDNDDFDFSECLILHLKKLEFKSALILILVCRFFFHKNDRLMSEQDSLLIEQAYKYIMIFAKSTENMNLMWQLKIISSIRS